MKKLRLGDDARKDAVEALCTIANAVGSTLGPQGRPFVYQRLGADQRYKPTNSKDGFTVLNSLEFSDPILHAVQHFAQQAAASSVMASGDGTTSTCVLAAAVALAIKNSGNNMAQALARQLKKEARDAIENIRTEADKSPEMIKNVAMTSANGDEELTDVVLKAVGMSSAFGTIIAEKSPASKVRYKIERQDGYVGAKGYNYNNTFALSCSDAAGDNSNIDWHDPSILVFNGHLLIKDQLDPMLAAFNEVIQEKGDGQRLVIFAYEVGDEIINSLIVLNRKLASRNISVFVAKPRMSAEINSGLQIIRDVCAFTGAQSIDGGNYKMITRKDFGTCSTVRITPTQTILLGRSPNHWVEKRALQNKNIIETAESQFDKEITAIRNAELTEGLVKVEIGGGLMSELQERADRFDDASKAAQSCMREGALPGCGASYIRAGDLANVSETMKRALRVVHETIMSNYGSSSLNSFAQGQTVKLSESGVEIGDFKELGVVDAAETIYAVIRNGVDLGVEVASIGGYSLIESQDLEHMQRTQTIRDGM